MVNIRKDHTADSVVLGMEVKRNTLYHCFSNCSLPRKDGVFARIYYHRFEMLGEGLKLVAVYMAVS